MARLAIRGLGLVGGFGCGGEDLLRTIRDGRTPSREVEVTLPGHAAHLPVCGANLSPLDRHVARRKLRRTGRFSRLAMLAICEAMTDGAGIEIEKERLGLVTGTGYGALGATFGFLDTVIEDGDDSASPTLFAHSVPSTAQSSAGILLGIRGPGLTVSQFELSMHSALLSAQQWLLEGRVDAVLCGGVDEYFPVVGYCHSSFFGVGVRGPIQPFEYERQSAIVGEGAAYLLLTRDEGSRARYGYIESVQTGHLDGGLPPLSSPGICLVGADGHAGCAGHYARHLPEDAVLASYSPAFGSFPASPALDFATAAIGLERGALPTWPDETAVRGLRAGVDHALTGRRIDVLKIDREGGYGLATLSR
jgi:3-oxoacyl-[acyl-carrier-protein] synthase II